jgi:hypothetical protein
MLEELRRQIAQGERERVLSMLAHVEELLDELTLACENPSLRAIVARYFRALEAAMAALACAAGCVPPEPAEVGK